MMGCGFRGHRSLTYGFADEDGAFFVEYRKGKKFSKRRGMEFMKTLSSKFRHERTEHKPMYYKFDKDEFEKKILYWMDKAKTHMESIEKKNLGDSLIGESR